MAVTEEQRRAVYEEDCRKRGHIVTFEFALVFEVGSDGARVAGPDGRQPYLTCRRCGKVWLIVEQAADNYTAATAALDVKLLPQFRPVRVTVPKLPGLGGAL